MKDNRNGATIWARKTIESDIFLKKPDKWFKIWFFIVNQANHKDTDHFKRGECFLTGSDISQATGATSDQVKKCLSWHRDMNMIRTERSTRGFKIIINKYNVYQTMSTYSSTDSGTRKAPEKHHDKQECKNDKKIAEESAPSFSTENTLTKLDNGKDHDKLISLYWKFQKFKFENKEQYQARYKRDLRSGRRLAEAGYTGEQIYKTMEYCQKEYEKIGWTLETVEKVIAKVINK